jgi:hypothetical protein
MSKNKGKARVIFYIEPKQRVWIKEEAKKRKISQSEVIRGVLENYAN